MRDWFDGTSGVRLDLDPYLDDFDDRFWAAQGHGVWKLERQQHFRQPESKSWVAFSQGQWDEALRLLESNRGAIEDEYRQIAEAGISVQRVRVVEEPVVPYLQWELHSLHLRAQCGEHIRVVGPEQVKPFESAEPLPEIVTLGEATMYDLLYSEQGILEGGVRFTDPEVVGRCRTFIERMYATGEDLASYFERTVAGLQPPDGP
jgi:hypothetical protein